MHEVGGLSEQARGGERAHAPEQRGELWRTALTAFLQADAQDLLLLFAMIGLCWIRRVATLDPVHCGGDVVEKWEFIRQWFFSNSFRHVEWTHHMTRFGVNGLGYLAQALFGHGLRAYYVVPIGACLVQVAFVFGCAMRLSGRVAAVIASTMLIFTPIMQTAGSQMLPDLFTGTYGIVALYMLLRYADASEHTRNGWLIATAVVCFGGYLAKETMVFFFPGFLLGIWLISRRLPDLALFCLVLIAGFILECLIYRIFTDYPSRFAIIRHSHGGDGIPTTTFFQLFERYDHIDTGWVHAFYFFLAAFCGILGFNKDRRAKALLAVVGGFFFFLTFLVRGVNPLLLWHRFMSRYLDPAAPLVELANGLFLAYALEQFWEQNRELKLVQRLRVAVWPATVGSLCIGLFFGWLEWDRWHEHADSHPFKVGPAIAGLANDTYRRGLPVVVRETPAIDKLYYDRALHTVYGVYMDVSLLERDGKLPSFEEVKQIYRKFTYIVKDPNAYTPAKFVQLLNNGCVVEVRERNDHVSASPMTYLPARCDELLAQGEPDSGLR